MSPDPGGGAGRPFPRHGGSRDAGGCDPRLSQALGAAGSTPNRAAVLAALLDARVFATITATATGERRTAAASATGERPAMTGSESQAQMAIVLLAAPDGARALPVFSDLLALRTWRPDARPVPLTGGQACAAALEQHAVALVLDPGVRDITIDGQELPSLARGWVPIPGSSLAARRGGAVDGEALDVPAPLFAALHRAVAPEDLRAARLLPGPDGPVLGVAPSHPLDPAALAALAARVLDRLGPDLPPDGLDLTVIPDDGPGLVLLPTPGVRRWHRRRPGR